MCLKMLRLLFLVAMAVVTAKVQDDPAANQIVIFKEKSKVRIL